MRTIKSFVLRAGRTSPRQQEGLNSWLKDYLLPTDKEELWSLNTIFDREADTIVEIGFGMGASLLSMAKAHPETNYIGIEVHKAGLGSLAADLHDNQLTNVRLVSFDAVEVFQKYLPDNSLAGVQIFFPDPWPKKRHHKRRLVQPAFVQQIVKKIKPNGFIHCATDWQEYAEHILKVLSENTLLVNSDLNGNYIPKPERRPLTKFEQRGLNLGHGVWDLVFIRKEEENIL